MSALEMDTLSSRHKERTKRRMTSDDDDMSTRAAAGSVRAKRDVEVLKEADRLVRARSRSAIKIESIDQYTTQKKQKLTISAAFAFMSPARLDNLVRKRNVWLNINAITALMLFIVEIELAYIKVEWYITEGMKLVISVMTMILLMQLWSYYHFQVLIQASEWKINKKVELRGEKQLFRTFLLEVALCVIHPVPFLVPDWVGIFMFLRLYLVVRLVRDNNITYKLRGELARHLQQNRSMLLPPKHNWRLTLKALFQTKSVKTVVFFSLLLILSLAFAMHIVERDANPVFNDFFVVIYYVTITITSVGFGDVQAKSPYGRLMSMIIAISGVFVASLLVAVLAKTLELKRHQKYAVAWVALQHRSRKYKEQSAVCIALAWKWHDMKKRKRACSAYDETNLVRLTTASEVYHLNLLHSLRNHRRIRKLVGLLKLDVKDYTLEAVNSINRKVDNLEEQMSQKLAQLDALNLRLREVLENQAEMMAKLGVETGRGALTTANVTRLSKQMEARDGEEESSRKAARGSMTQSMLQKQQQEWLEYQRKYAEWEKQQRAYEERQARRASQRLSTVETNKAEGGAVEKREWSDAQAEARGNKEADHVVPGTETEGGRPVSSMQRVYSAIEVDRLPAGTSAAGLRTDADTPPPPPPAEGFSDDDDEDDADDQRD